LVDRCGRAAASGLVGWPAAARSRTGAPCH